MRNSIYERIESKGLADAKEIKRQGEEKAKQIEASTLAAARDNISQILKRVKDKNDESLKTKKTEYIQKAKQRSLLRKLEIINKTFDDATTVLSSLKDKDLSALVEKLILNSNLVGDEIIQVNNDDYPRYLKLFSSGRIDNGLIILDKLNQKLADKKFKLRLSNETVNISGGFLVIGTAFDINFSYKEILNTIKDKYETEVATLLFSEVTKEA